jgi:hypothetical protein
MAEKTVLEDFHALLELLALLARPQAPTLDEEETGDDPAPTGSLHSPEETGTLLIDTFDDTELCDEPWPEQDPQTGFYP